MVRVYSIEKGVVNHNYTGHHRWCRSECYKRDEYLLSGKPYSEISLSRSPHPATGTGMAVRQSTFGHGCMDLHHCICMHRHQYQGRRNSAYRWNGVSTDSSWYFNLVGGSPLYPKCAARFIYIQTCLQLCGGS